MLMFIAGLRDIPEHLYEAARIDGANSRQTFINITLPLLRPTILFVTVTGVIAHFQVFGQPYIITAGGGPGRSSCTVIIYLYQMAWLGFRMGYGAAVAVALAIIMAHYHVPSCLLASASSTKGRCTWSAFRNICGLIGADCDRTFAVLLPLLIAVQQSLMTNQEVNRWPPKIITTTPTVDSYHLMFSQQDLRLAVWLRNSLMAATGYTLAVLVICSPAAYAFARLRFPGNNILFGFLLLTIMLPSQVTLIPNYLLMRDLKLLDTFNALIWPGAANVFGVFLLRQFFMPIPLNWKRRPSWTAPVTSGASGT